MKKLENDCFIYDFWDCGNVRNLFKGVNREKVKKFRMTVEPIEEGEMSDIKISATFTGESETKNDFSITNAPAEVAEELKVLVAEAIASQPVLPINALITMTVDALK